ncbi:hypothetical protein AGLY_016403 [Aphis glycines]|uniref:DDE Tnp4 domain-containing protein n=1 Tax=Aphis glycines TaxID=307491 RepID=A0A6G0SXP5_APHGL|nr:hypothetical protein AGLY_016403 [Aphis glycines]
MELVASSIAIARKLLVLGYDESIQKSDLDDIFFYNWAQRTKRNRALVHSLLFIPSNNLMSIQPRNKSIRGRPLLDNYFCLILTLYMLANENETYRLFNDIQTGERFGISESTAFRVFKNTISSISNLEEKYIVWPRGLTAQRNISEFNNLRKVPFPRAFCVVDCSHIRTNGSLSDNSYLNRNHYHSVIVQGICDFEGEFINVFMGYPGSSHDAAVWINSPIHKKLIQNHYEVIPPNCFILGNSAYPLSEVLMKPYRDNGHLAKKNLTQY